VYITAKEMQKVEEDFRGSFDGIGVEFDIVSPCGSYFCTPDAPGN